MKRIKIIAVTIAIITLTITSCTNKNAEYNNALFDVHTEFQNNIKSLDEKLNSDSITNDSAIVFLANAKKNCLAQYAMFKKIIPTSDAVVFHNTVDTLLQKQLYTFTLQQKIYVQSEPDKEFSDLQDSLDANIALIDSFDIKVKAAQLNFARKNKFTLQ